MGITANRRFTLLGSVASLVLTTPVAGQVAPVNEPIRPPQRLCIYYGQPSSVNGSNGDAARAIRTFMNCDIVILGDGIEHPQHEDHESVAHIIAALNEAGKMVFGYVDLGVSTQNLDEATLRAYVDEWQRIGAKGIFFDDAGYDYRVARARQNATVDYVHGLGLSAFMNAWDIDDVLGELDEANQPNPPVLRAGDWYLAESWLVASGAYQPLDAWSKKADKALHYSRTMGIRIAAVSTAGVKKAGARDNRERKYRLAWWGAAMYGLGAWQWTDAAYGAADNTLRIYESAPGYGLQFIENRVHYSGDSAVIRSYSRATDMGRILVESLGGGPRGGFRK